MPRPVPPIPPIAPGLLPALPPLFMWAGGKRRLLPKYAPYFPDWRSGFGAYVEPFLGGGAVFAQVAAQRPGVEAVLGDANAELVGVYRTVKEQPEALLKALSGFEKRWAALATPEARKPYYYDLRRRYWALPEGEVGTTALLYFLMKTGFNGIWQTCKESKGRFGTPVGLATQKGPVVDASLVRRWSVALAHTDVLAQGYEATRVPEGAFVYCDPPYRDSFTTYSTAFGDDAQLALVAWCRRVAAETRSLVWLSNRDAGDGFWETHAGDAACHRIPVVYTAGRRKKNDDGTFEAKPAVEVLLVWDGRRA